MYARDLRQALKKIPDDDLVMVRMPDGHMFTTEGLEHEGARSFEGVSDGWVGTLWIDVDEY
jgi:hypothetical protein